MGGKDFGHRAEKRQKKFQKEVSATRILDMEQERGRKSSKKKHLRQEFWTYRLENAENAQKESLGARNVGMELGKTLKMPKKSCWGQEF